MNFTHSIFKRGRNDTIYGAAILKGLGPFLYPSLRFRREAEASFKNDITVSLQF